MSQHALKKLYYFTDAFPFGKGEKPFVVPELRKLSSAFDVTVVSLAPAPDIAQAEAFALLPDGVRLLHIPPRTRLQRLLYAAGLTFSKVGRNEMRRILSSDGQQVSRLVRAALYYGDSKALLRQMEKAGVFEELYSSVYYTFWFNEALLSCALKKQAVPQLKLASRIHGYDLYNERATSLWQCFQPFKLQASDFVFFLTEKARGYFKDNYCDEGLLESFGEKTVVCPLGCPAARPRAKDRRQGSFLLVSCSNVIPLKRIDLIVEALALLDDPTVRWVHFGDGSELVALKALAHRKGVTVDFRGFTPNDEVLGFYAANHVDAFVTTSSSEGLPVSVQEAMAYGIPIIGTDVGGVSEEIDGNGVLLEASPSPEAVAEALKKVRDASMAEISSMRRRSVELWRGRYDQQRCLNMLDHALKSLAAR